MTPINLTAPLDDQATARRALLREKAQDDLSAATAALARLTSYALHLQRQTWDATTDDATLKAVADQARDLRRCAEALSEGVA